MLTPGSDWGAVLDAIVDAPVAWQTVDDIAASMGAPAAEVGPVVATLELPPYSLTSRWDRPDQDETLWTLSPLGAARMGVELVESDEAVEMLKWSRECVSIRSNRLRPSRAAVERTDDHDAALDQAPDRKQPDQRDVIEAHDYLSYLLSRVMPRKGVDPLTRLPLPTVCVGLSNPVYLPRDEFSRHNPEVPPRLGWHEFDKAWSGKKRRREPAPDWAEAKRLKRPVAVEHLQGGRECPGCRGGRLESYECCPRCARWGLDASARRLAAVLDRVCPSWRSVA
jgi:hypothetical protein